MNKLTKKPYCSERCYEYDMVSSRGLAYRIMIAEPADDPPSGGYGVIYTLDGDAVFQTLAETVRIQTRKPKGYHPTLVVAIGYPSREPFDLNRRCRDFTMPIEESALPVRPDGRTWPEHSGADEFLDFLEQELMPAITEEWSIDPMRQLIFGHSLGGLFTLHALSARPHLFSHYASGSPSVWWGENKVLKELEGLIDSFKGEQNDQLAHAGETELVKQPLQLLLAIGANELPDMLEGVELVVQLMSQASDDRIRTSRIRFADEEHVSVLPAAISRLPRFLWSN